MLGSLLLKIDTTCGLVSLIALSVGEKDPQHLHVRARTHGSAHVCVPVLF